MSSRAGQNPAQGTGWAPGAPQCRGVATTGRVQCFVTGRRLGSRRTILKNARESGPGLLFIKKRDFLRGDSAICRGERSATLRSGWSALAWPAKYAAFRLGQMGDAVYAGQWGLNGSTDAGSKARYQIYGAIYVQKSFFGVAARFWDPLGPERRRNQPARGGSIFC